MPMLKSENKVLALPLTACVTVGQSLHFLAAAPFFMKEAFTAPFTPECCPSVTLGTGLRSALVLTGTGKIPYSTLVGN